MEKTGTQPDETLVRFYAEALDRPASELPLQLLSYIEQKVHDVLGENASYEEISARVGAIHQRLIEAGQLKRPGDLETALAYLVEQVERVLNENTPEDLDQLLKRLKILHIKLNRVILRPDTLEFGIGEGDSTWEKDPELHTSKFKLLLQVLRDLEIYTDDIVVLSGIVTASMMREKTYLIIEIPALNKIVLINEGYGEASFVIDGMWDRAELVENGKIAIAELGAKKVCFNEKNTDEWKAHMKALLKGTKQKVDTRAISKARDRKFNAETKRDKAYYENPAKVKYDLEAYARAAEVDSPLNLSTNFNGEAVLSTGEKVKFQTYLRNAGVALGSANAKEANGKLAEIRDTLLRTAGYEVKEYEPRDKDYYRNPTKVKYDLEAYARAMKPEEESPSPLNLSTNFNGEAVLSNGETVKFQTYLKNAGVKLGLATTPQEAHGKLAEIRDTLLRTAGYEVKEVKEYEPRDKAYYKNRAKVKYDLEAYARAAEVDSPLNLSTNFKGEAVLSNGETVKFKTYLRNARVKLGPRTTPKEAQGKLAEIRGTLLRTAGYEIKEYEPRDKAYYKNRAKVKYDLEAYARAMKPEEESPSPFNLTTGFNGEAVLSNGETVKFVTYILNAGVALGFAATIKEAHGKLAEIRDTLLKIAGYLE